MLAAARSELIAQGGLQPSVSYLSFERMIAKADVARSAGYSLWRSKEDFFNDVLLDLAREDQAGRHLLGSSIPLEQAAEFIRAGVEADPSVESRTALILIAALAGADANYLEVAQSVEWRIYTTLAISADAMPEELEDVREELLARIGRAEEEFMQYMADYYQSVCEAAGMRLRAELDGEWKIAATIGASIVEGFAFRAQRSPTLSSTRFVPSALPTQEAWSLAAFTYAQAVRGLLEPDPEAGYKAEVSVHYPRAEADGPNLRNFSDSWLIRMRAVLASLPADIERHRLDTLVSQMSAEYAIVKGLKEVNSNPDAGLVHIDHELVNFKNSHAAEDSTIIGDFLYPDSTQTQAAPEADAEMSPAERSLGQIAMQNRLLQEASDTLDAQVVSAREKFGLSWTQIAKATGISPQAAHQRWSETGKQRHRAATDLPE